jgi:hypothetical protein
MITSMCWDDTMTGWIIMPKAVIWAGVDEWRA